MHIICVTSVLTTSTRTNIITIITKITIRNQQSMQERYVCNTVIMAVYVYVYCYKIPSDKYVI